MGLIGLNNEIPDFPDFVKKDIENAVIFMGKVDLFVKKFLERLIEKNPDCNTEDIKYIATSMLNSCIDSNLNKNRTKWRSIEEAKKWAKKNKIKTKEQWEKFWKKGKLPNDIPRYPHLVYGKNCWSI